MIFRPLKGPGTLHSQPVLKGMLKVKQPLFHGKDLGTIIQLKRCHLYKWMAFRSQKGLKIFRSNRPPQMVCQAGSRI